MTEDERPSSRISPSTCRTCVLAALDILGVCPGCGPHPTARCTGETGTHAAGQNRLDTISPSTVLADARRDARRGRPCTCACRSTCTCAGAAPGSASRRGYAATQVATMGYSWGVDYPARPPGGWSGAPVELLRSRCDDPRDAGAGAAADDPHDPSCGDRSAGDALTVDDTMRGLVAELMPLVRLWQQLLADHQPDHRGRCRACTEGGTGRAVTAWPCLLYRLAGQAAVAHHVAHYAATGSAFNCATATPEGSGGVRAIDEAQRDHPVAAGQLVLLTTRRRGGGPGPARAGRSWPPAPTRKRLQPRWEIGRPSADRTSEDHEHMRSPNPVVDLRERRMARSGSCYYTVRRGPGVSCCWGGCSRRSGGFGQVERAEQGLLAGGGRGALGDLPGVGGQGDQVHPVEFAAGCCARCRRWRSRSPVGAAARASTAGCGRGCGPRGGGTPGAARGRP